jgi:hypothetical protein
MMSMTSIQDLSISGDTGEKPQSKVFEYAGQWWAVLPNSSGTQVFRLDGNRWTATYQITTNKANTDVKVVGSLAHILLFDGSSSQIATLQYDLADNRFEPWAQRPQLVNVPISSSAETATLDVDSTGRMWVVYDTSSAVEVRYSDGLYTSWSSPITVASGISSDDITDIIAMPNNQIGVLWSNQKTDRFGFRVHRDGDAPTVWQTAEVAAGQSALNVGGGMADDHVHLAVASDGTIYAAVKTSYDKSGYAKIALLVRRPNGVWDYMYTVDTSGTRAIVVLNEAANKLIVAYTQGDHASNIVFRESSMGTISFKPRQVLLSGSLNNVTSTKYTSNDEIVFFADDRSVLFSFDTGTTVPPPNFPPTNTAPTVNAGDNRTAVVATPILINATVTDDNLPTPAALAYSWTRVSGPTGGVVTFGSGSSEDTTLSFTAAGTYVVRLTANDGQASASDEVTIVVSAPTNPNTPPNPTPTGPASISFQDGLFPNVTYAGTTDTKIASKNAATNYGTAQTFDVDGDPDVAALLRWDVSAIPTGSIIVSAAIELNITGSTKNNYEVYALQRAWDEISATWQHALTGQNWGTAGATGGPDRSSTVLGTLGPVSTGTQQIQLNAAGIAAVQAWINDPSSNFGIILQDYAATDGVDFRSSETGTASQRPKLIINYESAPEGGSEVASDGPSDSPQTIENLPPAVSAGADQSVVVGTPLNLAGSAADDSQPSPTLDVHWQAVSGPGTVVFADAASPETVAHFSEAGTYTLRLTATDGEFSVSDLVTVTVTELPASSEVEPPQIPEAPSPTAEILFQDGLFPNVTYAGTSDTKIASKKATTNYGNEQEFDVDGDPDVATLLRWEVSAIPAGSIVVAAAIEFNVTGSTKSNYEVYALQRAWDEVSATWQRALTGQNWGTAGATGGADRSSTVLGTLGPASTGTQRIQLNAAGIAAVQAWINNRSSNFGIILQDYTSTDGVDFRSSETGTASHRPKLVINYEPAPTVNALAFAKFANSAPTVNAGADFSVPRNQVVQLHGTVTDDGDLNLLTVLWTKQSGPGTVTFGDANSEDTTVQFSAAGTYVLRLFASDGDLSAFDELTVSVT